MRFARLRKFGGRCVLGFQSIAQVSSTYGQGNAHTIVENCGNTLIFRCSASEGGGTARFASQLIGEREVMHTTVSKKPPRSRELLGSVTHSAASQPGIGGASLAGRAASRPRWLFEICVGPGVAKACDLMPGSAWKQHRARTQPAQCVEDVPAYATGSATRIMTDRTPAMDDATMKFGLLMESAQAHRKLAETHLDKLRAHTGPGQRGTRRNTANADRGAANADCGKLAGGRVLGGSDAAPACASGFPEHRGRDSLRAAIPLAIARWFCPRSPKSPGLRARRDELTANVSGWNSGGRIDWRRCGETRRLCVRVDRGAQPTARRPTTTWWRVIEAMDHSSCASSQMARSCIAVACARRRLSRLLRRRTAEIRISAA